MFTVKIVTPSNPVRSFESEQINIVTPSGEMGLLSHHMPLVSALSIGMMSSIHQGTRSYYAIAAGVIFFEGNVATILSDAVEHQDEIDLARAQEARLRAEAHLKSKDPNIDVARAELALLRALNRINIGRNE
jgi:F-type H+-transporting ATPase subunit epsilon